jgi:hypothetical protein
MFNAEKYNPESNEDMRRRFVKYVVKGITGELL